MPAKSRVFVVNSGLAYLEMFRNAGWEITSNIKEADLIQFTGGADVSPELYGQQRHPATQPNLARDYRERMIFNLAKKANKPMAGICRGGQLLNVLCGGSLYQDVDGHYGDHPVTDADNGITYPVSSDHHQMMQIGIKGVILAYAGESTMRDICFVSPKVKTLTTDHVDPEIVWYEKDRCLCVQFHPEYPGYEYLADIYFGYLRHYMHLTSTRPEPPKEKLDISPFENASPIEKSLASVRKSLEAQPNPSLTIDQKAELMLCDNMAERQAKIAEFGSATNTGQVH